MADTTFQSGTIIASDWLNDINDFFYTTCGGQDGGGITQVLNGAGTVSAPSYSFSADPDSGLYSVSANIMAMAAGGDVVTYFQGVTNSVNALTIKNAITADYPALYPLGSDSNIGLIFDTKGTGDHQFRTGLTDSNIQAVISHTASAVNYWGITGSATGNSVSMRPFGADTNIGVSISSKGTGVVDFFTNAGATRQLRIRDIASAVNYMGIDGAIASGYPRLLPGGSDTNIGLMFSTKGTGSHQFRTGAANEMQANVTHVASSVNYVDLRGAVTGAGAQISSLGTDSNIDLLLVPKGSGVVRFGTHSALAAETVTGYITIKDSGGTSRKIAVVS